MSYCIYISKAIAIIYRNSKIVTNFTINNLQIDMTTNIMKAILTKEKNNFLNYYFLLVHQSKMPALLLEPNIEILRYILFINVKEIN